jgi:hypothetical protein
VCGWLNTGNHKFLLHSFILKRHATALVQQRTYTAAPFGACIYLSKFSIYRLMQNRQATETESAKRQARLLLRRGCIHKISIAQQEKLRPLDEREDPEEGGEDTRQEESRRNDLVIEAYGNLLHTPCRCAPAAYATVMLPRYSAWMCLSTASPLMMRRSVCSWAADTLWVCTAFAESDPWTICDGFYSQALRAVPSTSDSQLSHPRLLNCSSAKPRVMTHPSYVAATQNHSE